MHDSIRPVRDRIKAVLLASEDWIQSRLSVVQNMQLEENLAETTYFYAHQTVAYVEAEFGIRYTC